MTMYANLFLLPLLAMAAFTGAPLPSQSPLRLTGTYRVVGVQHDRTCSANEPSVRSVNGSMSFGPGPTFAWNLARYEACQGSALPPDNGASGSYEIDTESIVELDWGAGLRPDASGYLAPDLEVFVIGRDHTPAMPQNLIGIRTTPNIMGSVMAGQDYHIMRIVYDYQAALVVEREFGVATFGGSTWSETVETLTMPGFAGGTLTRSAIPYTVTVSGELAVAGGTVNGIVAGSGEIATWTIDSGQRTEWVVAVRMGTSRSSQLLDGRWGTSSHGLAQDPGPTVDYAFTQFGEINVQPFSSVAATFSALTFDSGTEPFSSGGLSHDVGSFTLAQLAQVPPGRFDVAISGFWAPPLWRAAVSSDGRFLLSSYADDGPEGEISMGIAIRTARFATPYGSGTAGAGGNEPRLASNSFPYAGNAVYALAVEAQPSETAAIVATSVAPGMAPFAGGHFWIDVNTALAQFLVLSNGSGSLSWPSPNGIPNNPALRDLVFYAQAGVLSPSANLGVALTNGLRIEIGR